MQNKLETFHIYCSVSPCSVQGKCPAPRLLVLLSSTSCGRTASTLAHRTLPLWSVSPGLQGSKWQVFHMASAHPKQILEVFGFDWSKGTFVSANPAGDTAVGGDNLVFPPLLHLP